MDIQAQRDGVHRFLRQAAKAQDAEMPLKSVDFLAENGDELLALQVFKMITVDDVEDSISVTIEGRMFAGLLVGDVPDFGPGKLAEMTGSITETELAARYAESKVRGIERAAKDNPNERETYLWLARVLRLMADEFRQQLHIPEIVHGGVVVPYNESNETGIKHQANLRLFFSDVHERNVRAGWWSDLETGAPKKRSVGELLVLIVTELAEAYDAWLLGAQDDKLPEYPGMPVEIGDALIRIADFCGAMQQGKILQPDPARNPGDLIFREIVDLAAKYEAIRKTPNAIGEPEHADFLPAMEVAEMVDAKLAFNAQRADHKIENRLKEDGKKT